MCAQREWSRRKTLGWFTLALAGAAGTRVVWEAATRYDAPFSVPASGALRVGEGATVRTVLRGYRVEIDDYRWHVTAPNGLVLWNITHAPVTAVRGSLRWSNTVGHFSRDRRLSAHSTELRINHSTVDNQEITVHGRLSDDEYSWPLWVRLAPRDGRRMEVTVEVPGVDAVLVSFGKHRGEGVHGLGEQFAPFDLDGRSVPVVTREQGVGRGRQPLTLLAELTEGAGGDLLSTYAPLPFAVTDRLRGIALAGTRFSVWDLRDPTQFDVTSWATSATLTLYCGDSPRDVVSARSADTGRPPAPPRWSTRGAVLGLQGGTAEVRRKLATVREAGTPVAAVWLQDWVGTRVTSFGDRLWWTWELDEQHYPGWRSLVDELHAAGIRVLTYVNPYVVGDKPGLTRDLFAEAGRLGYLVRAPDGSPYLLDQGDFSAGMIDLSDPLAREWYTRVIAEQVAGAGVDGWMADFGEALPFDAVLATGDPAEWHNRWPDEWARVNRDACRLAGLDEPMVFHRSAGPATPGLAPMMWAGDQLVTFGAHDGMRSALRGMLAAGVSGIPFVHSDTGGYTGLDQPIVGVARSAELLARWAELSAWGIMLRTHEGNQPERFAQVYDNPAAAATFAAQARVFAALSGYRQELADRANRTGVPVLRHGWLAAREPRVDAADEQFFFGDSFLVAPVLREGERSVRASLPAGRWVHLWSGKIHGDPAAPTDVTVPAPIGQPGVFYRTTDSHAAALRPTLLDALDG